MIDFLVGFDKAVNQIMRCVARITDTLFPFVYLFVFQSAVLSYNLYTSESFLEVFASEMIHLFRCGSLVIELGITHLAES